MACAASAADPRNQTASCLFLHASLLPAKLLLTPSKLCIFASLARATEQISNEDEMCDFLKVSSKGSSWEKVSASARTSSMLFPPSPRLRMIAMGCAQQRMVERPSQRQAESSEFMFTFLVSRDFTCTSIASMCCFVYRSIALLRWRITTAIRWRCESL